MEKIIICIVLTLYASVTSADDSRGLFEDLLGTTPVQISNLDQNDEIYFEKLDRENASIKITDEKLLSGWPHHDTIKLPIPTIQTLVIHKPKPEPIHIYKPPKEQIHIHESKPHESIYYVVKPPHEHQPHKPIYLPYSEHNDYKPNHEPIYVYLDHKHPQPSKPHYKPEHYEFIKPHHEISSHKPLHTNNHHNSNQHHTSHIQHSHPHNYYKPVYEDHEKQPSNFNEHKKPDHNIIIQILTENPNHYLNGKPEIIHINPDHHPIYTTIEPVQFTKPGNNYHHDSKPIFVANHKPDQDPYYSHKPEHDSHHHKPSHTSFHGIKDAIANNGESQNIHEDVDDISEEIPKKPLNFWDLLVKPFQPTSVIHNDDEPCDGDAGSKPIRCIFKSTHSINKTKAIKDHSIEETVTQNLSEGEDPVKITKVTMNSQPPSFLQQFWMTNPLIQRHKPAPIMLNEDEVNKNNSQEEEDDNDVEYR